MESLLDGPAVEHRPVPGFEECDRYRVCGDGLIRSRRGGQWVPLKTFLRGRGYHIASLWLRGQERRLNVAHLVLEAFVGPRPEGAVCRHLDGDRNNNAASNLRWGTLSENVRDSIRHGTHGVTKLTPDQVHEIRRSEEPPGVLAGRFGVHARYIREIRARRYWGWL